MMMEEVNKNQEKFKIIKVIAWCFLIFQLLTIVCFIWFVHDSVKHIYTPKQLTQNLYFLSGEFIYLFICYMLTLSIVIKPINLTSFKMALIKTAIITILFIIPAIVKLLIATLIVYT